VRRIGEAWNYRLWYKNGETNVIVKSEVYTTAYPSHSDEIRILSY
jgi:uncharacterized protein YegP (UPF0339 family)